MRTILVATALCLLGSASSLPAHDLLSGAGVMLSTLESTDGDAVQFRLKSDSANRRLVALDNSDNIQSQLILGDDGTFDFVGSTVATNRLHIGPDIGVGTDTPEGSVHIRTASANAAAPSLLADDLVLENQAGTSTGMTILTGGINGAIYFGDGAANDVGFLNYNHTSDTLSVQAAGGPRMRWDEHGTIMDTVAMAGNNPLCWSGSTPSYIGDCTASAAFKKNIRDAELDALSAVLKLKPRRFEWDGPLGSAEDLGFVAEEVREVSPDLAFVDAASGRATDIDERALITLLVRAIQELHEELAGLRR